MVPFMSAPSNTLYLSPNVSLHMSSPPPFTGLLSPIKLDSPPRPAPTVSNHLSSPKRSSASNQRVSPLQGQRRRRRHGQSDCVSEWCCAATTFFDQLPWISALDKPDQSGVHDIADLSQLDIRPLSDSLNGPGPVRRRKSSLRSSPRHAATENIFADLPSWVMSLTSSSSCSVRTPSAPRTPRNLRAPLSPSRARFHNLLPVFSPPARLKCESLAPSSLSLIERSTARYSPLNSS